MPFWIPKEHGSVGIAPTWELQRDVLVLVEPDWGEVAQLVWDDEPPGGRLRTLPGEEVNLPARAVEAQGRDLDGLGVHDDDLPGGYPLTVQLTQALDNTTGNIKTIDLKLYIN